MQHDRGSDLIYSDQPQGVRLLMDHLRSLGHERIGHVTGLGGSATIRRQAYARCMEAAGQAHGSSASRTKPTRRAAIWAPLNC